MTLGERLSGVQMAPMGFIFLLVGNTVAVSTQFNGYNCDANHHSRFPGEKTKRHDTGTERPENFTVHVFKNSVEKSWYKIFNFTHHCTDHLDSHRNSSSLNRKKNKKNKKTEQIVVSEYLSYFE